MQPSMDSALGHPSGTACFRVAEGAHGGAPGAAVHDARMTIPSELPSVTDVTQGAPLPGDADLIHRLSEALGAQYVVVRRLAQGGFSDVFEICDIELDRRLAVKVLRPDVAWTHGMRARFKQEARAIAKLNHPNTVPIHFVGESDGLVFYVMSYVEGRTMADLLQSQGPLDALLVAQLTLPVLEALEHAHSLGIVHRDIKPDNVLIEGATGRPMLVDFGIAKCLDGVSTHTQAGFVVGTPLYMSPEQALGRDTVDARADLYALGTMLFQLLTGAPPFDGKTSAEIVGKHLTEPVPVPSHLNARIPVWMSDVIIRCMAKDPADRFASAGHVMEALRAGLATAPVEKVTAARLVARLEGNARSPITVPAVAHVQAVPGGHSGQGGQGGQNAARGKGKAARWAIPAVVAASIGIFAFTAASGGRDASVTVGNKLLSPVWLTVSGERAQLIQPGDSIHVTWPASSTFSAEWSLVRPVSNTGKPMGEALHGTLTIDDARGSIRRDIDITSAGAGYFAPRITNASGVPLKVGIGSAPGEQLCDCEVPSSTTPVWLGYYRMAPTTSVRVNDGSGREAIFDRLDARIDGAGELALTVAKSDLPYPAPQKKPVRAATRSNVLAAKAPPALTEAPPPPVTIIEPEPMPEPILEPVVHEAPKPEPKPVKKSTNPVGGFLSGVR